MLYGNMLESVTVETQKLYWQFDAKTNAQLNADRFKERVFDLERRLQLRLEELAQERSIVSKPPTILGGAWVVPRHMLNKGEPVDSFHSTSPEARALMEQIAMETVMEIERSLGNFPEDVGKQKIGYDIASKTPDDSMRFIEVKGRHAGVGTVTVTHNEMVVATNNPDNAFLALVEVDGNTRRVTYLLHWNEQAPRHAVVNQTIHLNRMRQSADIVFEKEILC